MFTQHPTKKLGKRAPKIDPRTLQFAKYLPDGKVVAPNPPPEVSWIMEVQNWGMLGNDVLGLCVEAMMMHSIQQMTHYAGSGVVPTTAETINLYSLITGYDPADPNSDQGTVMIDAMNYWRKTGVNIGNTNHKIAAYVQVDHTNWKHVQTAIQLFGNVQVGIALPVSAQTQTAWTVTDGGPIGDGSPGSWGGHGIPFMAGSPLTWSCITWGDRLKMSHNFMLDYVDEMYAIVTQDWIEKNGLSPSGFNISALQSDLVQVTN